MEPTGTVRSSVINLVKTIVGAGMLAIPYAFRSDGVLVGVLLVLLAASTSAFGLFVLAKCSKTLIHPRNSSFFSLCMLTYPSLSPLFDLAMITQCFGVGLSYLVLIGDLFPGLFGGPRELWIFGSAAIVVPLCLLRKLDSLKYSSVIGLFALAYLSLLVISTFAYDYSTDHYHDVRGNVSWFKIYDSKGLVSTFSIIIFAYTGSMNLFSIANELKDNSLSNLTAVINRSVAIATVIFLSVALSGYLTFGSKTLGNIMLNYDPTSMWVHIGKFCLGSMVVLTFPLLFHPCRIAVNNLCVWFQMRRGSALSGDNSHREESEPLSATTPSSARPISLSVEDTESASLANSYGATLGQGEIDLEVGNGSPPADMPDSRFYIITALLLTSMYGLALNVTSFATVLAVVGATGSTSISFTLPGLFGYKLIGTDYLAAGQLVPVKELFYKRCSILLVWFGISVMVLSLYVIYAYGAE
ncbi:AVT7 (YIL088C) [Zygosaccharomyces parabailii]|nr:AVT7 (YIL088C) [Zygosaccharomyces parabailii]